MTRVESIFGTVLAVGILAVLAFILFGQQNLAPGVRGASLSPIAMFEDETEYVAPTSACDCYNYAYDFARAGVRVGGVDYAGQVAVCYDRFGRTGASAFEFGYNDFLAEPRRRKSCPAAALR